MFLFGVHAHVCRFEGAEGLKEIQVLVICKSRFDFFSCVVIACF
jgi:hypothetical protein